MHKRLTEAFSSRTFLTFGGNETYLQYVQGFPLREFCAFEVATDEVAWQRLQDGLLRPIVEVAATYGYGVIADCMVWRASADYVDRLGYGSMGVAGVNALAVGRTRRFLEQWRAANPVARTCPVFLAADVGPRGDGYVGGALSAEAARQYHRPQLEALAEAEVDLVVALTMTSVAEAVGIVEAASEVGLPVLVSPTIETDGRVPDGVSLGDFVQEVDDATSGLAVGYIANCAHPTHLGPTLRAAGERGESWLARFRGLRANASAKSHAELDQSTVLDRGDPEELGRQMGELCWAHGFTIVGGCCGTDAEHMRAIAAACA